jgi:hypothetical protein
MITEVVPKGHQSCLQSIANCMAQWSSINRFKLNNDKCKELRICFVGNQQDFQPIRVNGIELEAVESAKLLGVTVSCNLTWNVHNNVVKKAAKQLYFLIELRAKLPRKDLVLFYITYIQSILTYASPVFFMPCQCIYKMHWNASNKLYFQSSVLV